MHSRQKGKKFPGEKLEKQKNKLKFKKEVFFLIKFFMIFFALQFLILALPLEPLKALIAGAAAGAAGLQSAGSTIAVGSENFEITNSCTGLVSWAILIAVIFPLKKPEIRKKVAMALAGGLALFLLNFPRILLVLWAAQNYGSETAEILHEATWITTAVLVLIIWFIGTKKIAKIKSFAEMI